MRKLLLSLGLVLGLAGPALAQVGPCVGVGGVNTVPQVGITCPQDSTVPTYGATSVGLVPGTAATDLACIQGSATKTIRVKRIRISGTAGTAINYNLFLVKRVSLNTGGTAATSTALPAAYALDSSFPAATATLNAWTANPTLVDTSPGYLDSGTVFLPVTSTGGGAPSLNWYWDEGGPAVGPPALRAATQAICVNANGATAPSTGAVNITFMWTEQ